MVDVVFPVSQAHTSIVKMTKSRIIDPVPLITRMMISRIGLEDPLTTTTGEIGIPSEGGEDSIKREAVVGEAPGDLAMGVIEDLVSTATGVIEVEG